MYPPPPPGGYPMMYNVPPLPGYQMRPPAVAPQPGQVVVAWELVKPEPGCCRCDGLSTEGLISVILLIVFFWPLAWLPCLMGDCFSPYQRPVYGFPPGGGPPQLGVPVQQAGAPAAQAGAPPPAGGGGGPPYDPSKGPPVAVPYVPQAPAAGDAGGAAAPPGKEWPGPQA